eukprot:257920-Hanusia_phi.AAC.2
MELLPGSDTEEAGQLRHSAVVCAAKCIAWHALAIAHKYVTLCCGCHAVWARAASLQDLLPAVGKLAYWTKRAGCQSLRYAVRAGRALIAKEGAALRCEVAYSTWRASPVEGAGLEVAGCTGLAHHLRGVEPQKAITRQALADTLVILGRSCSDRVLWARQTSGCVAGTEEGLVRVVPTGYALHLARQVLIRPSITLRASASCKAGCEGACFALAAKQHVVIPERSRQARHALVHSADKLDVIPRAAPAVEHAARCVSADVARVAAYAACLACSREGPHRAPKACRGVGIGILVVAALDTLSHAWAGHPSRLTGARQWCVVSRRAVLTCEGVVGGVGCRCCTQWTQRALRLVRVLLVAAREARETGGIGKLRTIVARTASLAG